MKTKHPSPECDTCHKDPCECKKLQQQELLRKLTQLNKEVQDLLEELKMNFKITTQRILFKKEEIINESNKTKTLHIIADDYRLNYDTVEITEHNLTNAKRINPNYEIGCIHISPLNSVSFLVNGVVTKTINVFADPYYKLEVEKEDGSWEIL